MALLHRRPTQIPNVAEVASGPIPSQSSLAWESPKVHLRYTCGAAPGGQSAQAVTGGSVKAIDVRFRPIADIREWCKLDV